MEHHKTQTITCNGTTMGRFPQLTLVRLDSQSPGAGIHNCHRLCKNLLWPNKGFMSKIFNIVFDEGHCISQWGSTFCPEYKLVGILLFIAPGIPFYITSATILCAMPQDIKETLHIPTSSLLFQRSNDQHNIAFYVKRMQHAMSSFKDLAFLVPSNWTKHDCVPRKFMVFFDSKCKAELASIFLWTRMPENLKHKVKWFHTGMTESFRKEELQLFKEGVVGKARTITDTSKCMHKSSSAHPKA